MNSDITLHCRLFYGWKTSTLPDQIKRNLIKNEFPWNKDKVWEDPAESRDIIDQYRTLNRTLDGCRELDKDSAAIKFFKDNMLAQRMSRHATY